MGVYVRVYVGRRGVPILGPYNHTVVDSKVVTDVGVVSILGNKPGRSQLFMCCFLCAAFYVLLFTCAGFEPGF